MPSLVCWLVKLSFLSINQSRKKERKNESGKKSRIQHPFEMKLLTHVNSFTKQSDLQCIKFWEVFFSLLKKRLLSKTKQKIYKMNATESFDINFSVFL